ncbi:MAG: YhbY family RNA-binding protein [Holophagaceae bacterium]|jgi:RNA-binding protein
MLPLTPKNRKYLKSQAHHLKPVLIIGKEGVTPSFVSELLLVINNKELIKCKLSKIAWENHELIENAICAIPERINIVDRIGHTLILFKSKPLDKTKFLLEEGNT